MHDESAWARNLGTLHDDRAAVAPDSTALVLPDSEETVTYGELADAIARAGNAVRDLGVERGDRVALCFENGPELVAVFFGTIRAGFVPVPVNVRSSVETVRHVVADSGSRVVVAGRDGNARAVAADAASECESATVLGTYGGSEGVDGVRTVDFEAHVDEASPTLDPVEVAFDDPALQPYSSGSTGVPKGIVLARRCVLERQAIRAGEPHGRTGRHAHRDAAVPQERDAEPEDHAARRRHRRGDAVVRRRGSHSGNRRTRRHVPHGRPRHLPLPRRGGGRARGTRRVLRRGRQHRE